MPDESDLRALFEAGNMAGLSEALATLSPDNSLAKPELALWKARLHHVLGEPQLAVALLTEVASSQPLPATARSSARRSPSSAEPSGFRATPPQPSK